MIPRLDCAAGVRAELAAGPKPRLSLRRIAHKLEGARTRDVDRVTDHVAFVVVIFGARLAAVLEDHHEVVVPGGGPLLRPCVLRPVLPDENAARERGLDDEPSARRVIRPGRISDPLANQRIELLPVRGRRRRLGEDRERAEQHDD